MFAGNRNALQLVSAEMGFNLRSTKVCVKPKGRKTAEP